MKRIVVYFILAAICSCKQPNSSHANFLDYVSKIKQIRSEKNKEFLREGSPIPADIRTNFLGLNYFPIDSNFRVKAAYIPLFELQIIEFKTNTERSPKYLAQALLVFEINGHVDTLTAFKDANQKSFELFVPFTDLTNGKESYTTGRYLDLSIPESDSLWIDFNLAYNPYCAYNKNYSCPIPPNQNHIELKVTAGERLFNEH